jgi:hypothetical protein
MKAYHLRKVVTTWCAPTQPNRDDHYCMKREGGLPRAASLPITFIVWR